MGYLALTLEVLADNIDFGRGRNLTWEGGLAENFSSPFRPNIYFANPTLL